MPRPKRLFRKGEIINVSIESLAFGGKGIARIPTEKGDFTVFVQNAIPGQDVSARVIKCKNSFAECKLETVEKSSDTEVELDYQPIPGAPYATLPIEEQHRLKQDTTLDLYKRIGGIENVDDLFDEFIASPRIWHYRNKMEYSFSMIRHDLESNEKVDEFSLGFKHRGTWWAVENLDGDSGLFDKEFEDNMPKIREYLRATGAPAWHPPRREGFFRFLAVRKSFYTNELLLNLVTSSSHLDLFDQDEFCKFLEGLIGERIAGVLHTINDDTGERVEPRHGEPEVIYGKPVIREQILGLDFDISMGSFFQTNPKSAEKLYSKAIDYLNEALDEGEFILDLFCGTGTITQLVSKGTDRQVIGVDIVKSAIEDAKSNAALNNLSSADFRVADVGKFLLEYPELQGKIGAVILDPPRSGISPKSLRKVIRLESPVIVYISCNPATQARDAEVLIENNYELIKLSLCDQFPHTAHIETVALFVKR